MKKVIKYIFIFALAFVSSFLMCEAFIKPNNSMSTSANIGTIVLDSDDNKLTDDKVITTEHTPIGTYEEPFTGTFDGCGKTITLRENSFKKQQYQGIFGYAQEATIKNLKVICDNFKVDATFDNDGLISEYFVGIILAYGNNVTIENCEIEGTIVSNDNDINTKLTFGGIIGKAENLSKISNCGSYIDVNFTYNLTNEYTIKTGGIVGEFADSSSMTFCVGYNDFTASNESTSVGMTLQQGGLVGCMNGEKTSIYNVAATSTFDTQELDIEDVCYTGGLIGSISTVLPKSGNIASCGYQATLNSVEVTDFYGNAREGGYSIKNQTTKDDVINILSGYMMNENFFKTDEYVVWHGLLTNWDFDSVWIVTNDKAMLQQFQNFEIKLVTSLDEPSPLDERYNTLTDETTYEIGADGKEKHNYNYGEIISFNIYFKDFETTDKNYEGFYKIEDIKRDNESINFSSFLTENLPDEDSKKITRVYSLDGNYELLTKHDTVENQTEFIFNVKAEYSTRGTYHFIMQEIFYKAYVLSENGGLVKASASSSSPKEALEPREVSKNYEWSIKAVPDYQYVFSTWTLWKEISAEVFEANKDKTTEFFKYERENGEITYWQSIQKDLADNEDLLNAMKNSDYKIVFGDDPFNENFMLKATFEKRVYSFNIKGFKLSSMHKIEVINKLGDKFIFDSHSSSSDYIELDRNETIILNIYLKSGYKVEESTLPNELEADYEGKTDVQVNGENASCYRFRISTSNFRYLVNHENKLSLGFVVSESGTGESAGMPTWLLIVIIAGGVVGLGLIILIIVLISKRRGGGGGGSKKSKSDYDYKQMFR